LADNGALKPQKELEEQCHRVLEAATPIPTEDEPVEFVELALLGELVVRRRPEQVDDPVDHNDPVVEIALDGRRVPRIVVHRELQRPWGKKCKGR
jgi:hypothetical protein